MLFSSLISNGIGVVVIQFLTQRSASMLSPEILRLAKDTNQCFLPASFILPFVLILLDERPIRVYLKNHNARGALTSAAFPMYLFNCTVARFHLA